MLRIFLKTLNFFYYKATDWPMPEYCHYLWNHTHFTFPKQFTLEGNVNQSFKYVKDYSNFINRREIVQIYTETTQERKRKVLLKFVKEAEKL